MKTSYVDIHIHTSEDPNNLTSDYNVRELLTNVKKISGKHPVLLSLTDHNTINKDAYLSLIEEAASVVLGVELHITKYMNSPPYHCHIIFNTDISDANIDEINKKLDELYPNKIVTKEDLNTPNIETVINTFDSYEFLLLPHGGQSHKTFNLAKPRGKSLDSMMEQSIYYNYFAGFTARSNKKLQTTKNYFENLGINEFTNLITCTDNYCPDKYPQPKPHVKEEFIPTWMHAEPNFEGLRLSLSEKSRLFYGDKPPQNWTKTFGKIELNNEKIEINVEMTPGLNVVIGGSSSGKTLFVDSLVNGVNKNFNNSKYKDFHVENIIIENPTQVSPYYISQNFIISIIKESENDLGDIPVLNKVFPEDTETLESIRNSLKRLKELINKLVDSAEKLEETKEDLSHIKTPNFLIANEAIKEDAIEIIKPSEEEKDCLYVSSSDITEYQRTLREIKNLLKKHPIISDKNQEIDEVMKALNEVMLVSKISDLAIDKIERSISDLNKKQVESDRKLTQIKEDRKKLLKYVHESLKALDDFYTTKDELSKFDVSFETKEIKVVGHTLSIKNSFKLSEVELISCMNKYLTKENRIENFQELKPTNLEKNCFPKRPKVTTHSDLANYIYESIADTNRKEYKIITREGREYRNLSPGWKSAIILDLVLGYENSSAPIIIDQPEDNLATGYINHDLIEMIKKVKEDKQVILVSHNATIPMLGDAQNIIICENDGEKIYINSATLESEIKGKKTLDWIAELTDGGKSSIKKRVKKYNFRSYKEN